MAFTVKFKETNQKFVVRFKESNQKFVAGFKETNQKFAARFKESNHKFIARFGQINTVTKYVGGSPYDGEYQVTPKVEEQILHTAQKVMAQDMIIKEIPYFEVSNTSGGKTVTIGN